MKHIIFLFVFTSYGFCEKDIFYKFENKQKGLINSYTKKIIEANKEKNETRLTLFLESFVCIKRSYCEKDLQICQTNERKKINNLTKKS